MITRKHRRTRSIVASALLAGALSLGAVAQTSSVSSAADTEAEVASFSVKTGFDTRAGFGIRW